MKKTLKETRRQGWLTLLALSVIAITVYIGFAPLFSLVGGGVAGAVIGSSFGAIFVIILTMYLLNKQTEIEQETKKSERVFDEKVRLYQQILDIARDILIDGNLSEEEINRLPFPVIRLQMLGADETIAAFQKVFGKLNSVYAETDGDSVNISENDRNEIFQMLSSFAGVCRKDLGISDKDVSEEISKETNQAIANSGKKERDYTKYSFDGKKLAKNRYVYSVITNYLSENPQLTLDQFKNTFFDKEFFDGRRKGQYEAWKTYQEVMDIHHSGVGTIRFYVSAKRKDIGTNKDMVLKLADAEICLSNFWGIHHMEPFRERLKEKGIKIE